MPQFSKVLNKSWTSYLKYFSVSSRGVLPDDVHRARIATQKMEAALHLSTDLVKIKGVSKLVRKVRKLRKELGPLRDLEVALKRFKKLGEGKKESLSEVRFVNSLCKKEIQKTKEIALRLRTAGVGQQKRLFRSVYRVLLKFDKATSEKHITKTLSDAVSKRFSEIHWALQRALPLDEKEMHRIRSLAKQIRYQVEIIRDLEGRSPISLDRLKKFQDLLGEIHDATVSRAMIKKYSIKNGRKSAATPLFYKEEEEWRRLILQKSRHIKV